MLLLQFEPFFIFLIKVVLLFGKHGAYLRKLDVIGDDLLLAKLGFKTAYIAFEDFYLRLKSFPVTLKAPFLGLLFFCLLYTSRCV